MKVSKHATRSGKPRQLQKRENEKLTAEMAQLTMDGERLWNDLQKSEAKVTELKRQLQSMDRSVPTAHASVLTARVPILKYLQFSYPFSTFLCGKTSVAGLL